MKTKIVYILLLFLLSCNEKKLNPREMNGKTFLVSEDSVYFITFKIDSVIEREYDPPEDPR